MASPATVCPSCSATNPDESRFCGSCGQPLGQSQMVTAAGAGPVAVRVGRLVSSASIPAGGLTPGAMLASRYRIVGLLGRGGMGEVYRADDLKLGQTVALKFLPRELAADPVRRERFFAEVRITRQLAHPNICRVYDIADVDGQHFLSMEFIDGEDLASLLTRIGYLSNEKALDVTRQLVAGLAAAHERGVLHRDLKPSNVMIDGFGRVRITDFGLAVAGTDEPVAGDVSGTPAYMAPEQLAGKGASVRTDIYALGLVIYEIVCGKSAFTAPTLAELRQQKEQFTPTAPSEIRAGIDPALERLIMRCIERDPRSRPASMAQLAVALPGGNALAVAIAAGETPSPELLIASGPTEGLGPLAATALLAVVVIGSLVAAGLNDRVGLVQTVQPARSADAMAERARTILESIGYSRTARDSAFGFYSDDDLSQYLRTAAGEGISLRAAGVVRFLYRQSPQPLTSLNPVAGVTIDDPPWRSAGDVEVRLDSDGRLRWLVALPPQLESDTATVTPDWTPLFAAAGLDLDRWTPVASQRIPTTYADARAAWTGALPDIPDTPVRVEAAAYGGSPVSFEIVGPWTPEDAAAVDLTTAQMTTLAFAVVILPAIAAFFARRNLRLGRGDRRSATRLALLLLVTWLLAWALLEHHVAAPGEVLMVVIALGVFLPAVGMFWVYYIAVEPFVRRRWPRILVSWTRLLAGDWRDALVGRDVLIGSTVGAITACLTQLQVAMLTRSQASVDWNSLNGAGPYLGAMLGRFNSSVIVVLIGLFMLFFLRVVLRHDWAAAAAFVVLQLGLVAGLGAFGSASGSLPPIVLQVLLTVISLIVLMRVGLVASFADRLVGVLLVTSPVTLQASAWYARIGFVSLFAVMAIALYGFRTSLAGRAHLADAVDA